MAIENVNLLKIQLVNQMRTFIKGMSVFFGTEVDTETDSELDIQSKVKMFLENPQLAEEMTLEDIVVLLEDFNDTLETATFKDVISSLKADIQGLRTDMIELVNKPVTVTNTTTEVIKETFNTDIFDSIQAQVAKIAGELKGYATKESVVKLQMRVRNVEDEVPVLQAHIDDLAKEIDVWKKKKEVPIHRGGDQSMTLGVTSVFGRTGPVVAVAGDYNASQITYTPSADLTAVNVQAAIDHIAAKTNTFETVSANLSSFDSTLIYTAGNISSIVYSNGITKTFNYTGDDITSIVLSGSTPSGIDLTKTLTYTAGDVTGIAYS